MVPNDIEFWELRTYSQVSPTARQLVDYDTPPGRCTGSSTQGSRGQDSI